MKERKKYKLCSFNPGEYIWHKVKKHSKIGQDKNIISNFACFLTAIVNV